MRTHLMIKCTVLAASFTLIQWIPFQAVPGGQPAGTTEIMEGQPSIHEAAVSLFLHRG
ncbi:MAG TPA: hypothetical protein VLA99_14080 [Nitrospiraceae bacterium]|nr:hypothetical protein [Nitrospiraceae bacterium]